MTEHPLVSAARSLRPDINAAADEIDINRKIPAELMAQLNDAGLFSLAVPKEFGGPEIDQLVVFDALEQIAMEDASTAWVVLIISANPYFFGNCLHEHVWQEMYGKDINTRTAGAIAPGARAVKTSGGYRVSGQLRYGSGSEHCEYLLSGCMVYEGDSLCVLENGEPELVWVIHKTSDCEILTDSWDATGLRGSSSHDYLLDDLFVPEDWSFVLGKDVCKLDNPVYGFTGIAFCQLGAITLGLAQASIRIAKDLAIKKRRGPILMNADPSVQLRVAEAEALCGSARAYIKEITASVLETLGSGDQLSWDQRAKYRLACTYAVDCSSKAINMMFKTAGGSAVYKPNQLDRILRDIHTASTHIQFGDLTYIQAGRMLLGVDPQHPLF
jgi:indole-3-acetate monooxygenase